MLFGSQICDGIEMCPAIFTVASLRESIRTFSNWTLLLRDDRLNRYCLGGFFLGMYM